MPTLREQALISLAVANVYAIIQIWIVAVPAALFGFWCLNLDNKKLVISDKAAGEPYLTRWHLFKCKWFRVFLHQIHRPDKDRHLHNHPWPWASGIILTGGYDEVRTSGLNGSPEYFRYRSLWWNLRNVLETFWLKGPKEFWTWRGYPRASHLYENTYHRILTVEPNTFTLFLAGPRSKDWGFNVDGEHVPSRTYLGLPPDHNFGD